MNARLSLVLGGGRSGKFHRCSSPRGWMLFAHCSAERAHEKLLQRLDAKPLVKLDMHLGEGSGAATVIPLIKSALALHSGMATFADASVSDRA